MACFHQMVGCVVFEWVGGGLGIGIGWGLSSSTVAAVGGHQQDCWGSSMLVMWQLAPVQFDIQNVRGRKWVGALTWVVCNGCLLSLSAATAVVVMMRGGGGRGSW